MPHGKAAAVRHRRKRAARRARIHFLAREMEAELTAGEPEPTPTTEQVEDGASEPGAGDGGRAGMMAHLVALLARSRSTLRALARWAVHDMRAAQKMSFRALKDGVRRLRTGRGGKRGDHEGEERRS
jgi:hypothetical protein